ncbi:hypothetical protein [Mameliella alba]|uniref:hypothetical protein n=1 Tax=Mameliella alba TaxID=561184 RepID=UPI000B52B155|nr:hypothetical protein [Mameliella alba]MBY6118798.1 hypothetical protein [Mameliella alba]OWV43734.1 hypothetical protein CDZ95_08670 [Mameliella alba]
MGLKLVVILVVLGLFAAAIVAIHRANRPSPQRLPAAPPPEGPSLDEQIAGLARAGLHLSPGVTRADIIDFGPEETYRGDPWRLLLLTYSIPVDRPPHPPFCPRACLLQTDGFDSLQDYAEAVAELSRVAEVPCEVTVSDDLHLRFAETDLNLAPRIGTGQIDRDILRMILTALTDRMPGDSGLFALDNFPQIAVFHLEKAGFDRIDTLAPDLLSADPLH